jgi:predicted SAM-dependent methyltransferase
MPNSARAVYCSHVLEHLTLDEFRITLPNIFGYLQSVGIFRLVVPDFEFMVKKYVESDSDPDAALRLLEESHLGQKEPIRGIRSIPRILLGRSKHYWMWDYKAMARELEGAGFVNVRRAHFNDSSEPRFMEVENPGRWDNCLGVECTHP